MEFGGMAEDRDALAPLLRGREQHTRRRATRPTFGIPPIVIGNWFTTSWAAATLQSLRIATLNPVADNVRRRMRWKVRTGPPPCLGGYSPTGHRNSDTTAHPACGHVDSHVSARSAGLSAIGRTPCAGLESASLPGRSGEGGDFAARSKKGLARRGGRFGKKVPFQRFNPSVPYPSP
ncbi:MAG: hypothetical protein RL514_2015 [Verrucomicrobiota bacterium]|jgi:hypothetical protein